MSSNGLTVLVADRDADLRHIASFPFEQVEAEDTLRPLAILAERPDVTLLFTDVMLSRMSGDEMARYLAGLDSKVVVLRGATRGVARLDQAAAEPPARIWLARLWHALGAPFRLMRRGGKRRPDRQRNSAYRIGGSSAAAG
jgi:CheY-like chemotaxis protein